MKNNATRPTLLRVGTGLLVAVLLGCDPGDASSLTGGPSLSSDATPTAPPDPANPSNPAGPQAEIRNASSVTQYGITWTFDRDYPVGQFVTGDSWVLGPVTVVSVTPGPGPAPADEVSGTGGPNVFGDVGLRDNKELRNGSMVVMNLGATQGYDSRGLSYSSSASISFPYTLGVDRSLISSSSHTTIPNQVMHHELMWASEKSSYNVMKTAAVLTCLGAAPPADAFRPTYVGGDKRIFRTSSLRWDRLQKLPIDAASVPAWAQIERYVERPWLDHLNGNWQGQAVLPNESQPSYGREYARILGIASLMLHLDVPQAQKQKLLYGLVQYGIDLRGMAQIGGFWNEGGGHTSGRKWPILFAGLMLDDSSFSSLPSSAIFHEDVQTYYGSGWHGQTALWQMVIHHGTRQPYLEKLPSTWDTWDTVSESYRGCCNARAWVGEALAALLMGAKSLWDHDAFFDNVEDWMRLEDVYAANRLGRVRTATETTAFDPFVTAFWRQHRAAVPAQADGATHRKWDVNVAGSLKWVPNPKP